MVVQVKVAQVGVASCMCTEVVQLDRVQGVSEEQQHCEPLFSVLHSRDSRDIGMRGEARKPFYTPGCDPHLKRPP